MGAPSGVHSIEDLELNQGEKWQRSPEMGASFEGSISCFEASDYPSLDQDGLKQVGAGLHCRMMMIIQFCNMTGPAHDQLHVWIMGYLPAIKRLSDDELLEDAENVALYLATYAEHFE